MQMPGAAPVRSLDVEDLLRPAMMVHTCMSLLSANDCYTTHIILGQGHRRVHGLGLI